MKKLFKNLTTYFDWLKRKFDSFDVLANVTAAGLAGVLLGFVTLFSEPTVIELKDRPEILWLALGCFGALVLFMGISIFVWRRQSHGVARLRRDVSDGFRAALNESKLNPRRILEDTNER